MRRRSRSGSGALRGDGNTSLAVPRPVCQTPPMPMTRLRPAAALPLALLLAAFPAAAEKPAPAEPQLVAEPAPEPGGGLVGSALETLVEEGLEVSSALAPGLVKHPVMAALDDRGRLFVAANAGANLDKEGLLRERPGSIYLLEDTNKDGVFDKATLFAEGLTFPQGALWVYDSLYVMSPPSLWRFADEDGDGYAEVREELVTGFDFTGNAADVHGPFLHPNGRLYWCHGRKGFAVADPDTGRVLEQGRSARIWSSQLGGGEVESFAGGGMDNPVEIDFTDEGEILGTVNLFYGRPRGDVLVHWVHGGAYPRFDQGQVLAEFRKTGDLLPPAHNFGHVAVSGTCRYRSGAVDPSWRDGWIVTHFNTGELSLTKLRPEGSTYAEEETRTVFRALKPDTHLTDVLEDHNGDLLVIDTGGWFRNGCPTSQIAKPEVEGTIYRISRKGEPHRPASYPDWERLSSMQVSHFLAAPDAWLRERAITELAVRGSPAQPELERILVGGESDPIARIGAVWALSRMKFSESADLLYETLTDEDARVRQAACNAIAVTRTWQIVAANEPMERAIELERNKTISGALASIVRSDEPAVARAAAAALGRMGEHRAIGALLGRLGRSGEDRFLEHALVYALIEIDDFETTRDALDAGDESLLAGVLRALDGMESSQLDFLEVLPHLESSGEAVREAALAVAADHPQWDAALANAFFDWDAELTEARRALLRRLVPTFAKSPPMLDYLTNLVTDEQPELSALGLELISLAPGIPFQEEWAPAFERALAGGGESEDTASAPDAGPTAALRALHASATDRFAGLLESLCLDEERDAGLRLDAARALRGKDGALPEAAFALAEASLSPTAAPEARSKAVSLLAGSSLTPAQRDRLVPRLGEFGPFEWGSFPDLFRKIDTHEQAGQLVEVLVGSPLLPNLEAEALRKRFEPHPEALATLDERFARLAEEREAANDRIEEFVASLAEADPAAGEAVFASGKGACLVCHRVGETGGEIGPDLTRIGRIRTARDLYESILYPSESIARDFDTWEIQTKGGGPARVGLVEAQSSRGLFLVDMAGQRSLVPHEDVASIRRVPVSLMPMGLEQTLAPEELRDLVAWLLERR